MSAINTSSIVRYILISSSSSDTKNRTHKNKHHRKHVVLCNHRSLARYRRTQAPFPSIGHTNISQWAFLTNLSSNPANTVIALVRNKAGTEERIAKELAGRTNVHVVQADLDNYKTLQFAADETARITGGGLDYLIANAAYVETWDLYDPIGVL